MKMMVACIPNELNLLSLPRLFCWNSRCSTLVFRLVLISSLISSMLS